MSSPAWRRRRQATRARIDERRQRKLVLLLLTGAGSSASSRAAFEAHNAVLTERFAGARQRWVLGWEDVADAAAAFEAAEDWQRVRPMWHDGEHPTLMVFDEIHEWTTPRDPAVVDFLRHSRLGLEVMPRRLQLGSWSAASGPSENAAEGDQEVSDRG